jgi:hypothetical protein
MNDDHGPEWFAAKRYGLGSSLPISWQGWVVLLVFIAGVCLATLLIRYSMAAYFSVVTILTVGLLVICSRTTRGGWRWRWGDDD